MAEGKVDLPEDLGTAAKPAGEPWAAKDYASGGNDEDKLLMGFLDESKDQAISENSIPLSPQWLYVKPSVGLSAASWDTRPPNSLPQGASLDSTQKDAWRLDGYQDKKEWRRNVPDVENSRRWREEERETGLLGRRERRKEGDRENDLRKNDRRSDNNSMRETSDSRTLPSSDRWHEVTSRNSGHESRRDSKWSSRWGPEDKEKDSRMEKKNDADKEDPHVEKQSIVGSNRPLSESDSRDKWRPRHRQEIHSGGPAVYRAAPGFGVERGRVEGPNIGFAPGRGRLTFGGGLPVSRSSSAGPIGAAPSIKSESLHGKSSLSADTFRYPRGKLLDIYRKHKMLSPFDTTPVVFEEVPPITQSSFIAPLAFVKPDSEEEAVLEDIWKGKVISSEVCYISTRETMERVTDCEIEPDSDVGKCKDKVNALSNVKDPGGMASTVSKDVACCNVPGSLSHSELTVGQANVENDGHMGLMDFLNGAKFGAINSAASLDVSTKLSDDSNPLFDTSFIQEIPGNDSHHQNSNSETGLIELGTSAELSLFYLDPQGNIQGPFLAEDIISWYDEGFFGTDLPVVLSDAPEGTTFRPLGEVIPDLSVRPQSTPVINPGEQSEHSDAIRGNLEDNASASDFSNYLAVNGQQWTSYGSEEPFNHRVQPKISEPDVSIESHYEKSPHPNSEISGGIPGSERQGFHDFSGQDAEEVLYTGRSVNSIQNPLGKLANEIHDLSRSGHQFLPSEMGQANSANHKVPTDNDVNPFGLSWYELEGTHHKGPLSSNIAGVGDQGRIINPLVGGDASLFRHKQEQFSVKFDPVVRDAWSSNDRSTSSNVLQDAMDASYLTRFEPESNHFNLEEHLLSQQFQKQQLQQQHLLSPHQNTHLTESYLEQLQGPVHHQQSINQSIPDMEHLLKLRFQQQKHLQQLEQQQQLHQHQQQQQLHHQMQLLQQQHQQQQHQQQHQLLLEQLLHQQLNDPSFGVARVDPLRGENTLDQVLYRQHLLHELQQQAHHLPRDHDSLDQLIQAKFGHNLHHEHHNELLDALSHPSRRHMLPLEQHLLGLQQEQLQARQFSIASRQQPGRDEERHVGGVWSVDESGQFIRTTASAHQTHRGRLGQLDFVQPLQRPSSFEQPSHLERSFLLHDRMQRDNYGSNSQPFERSAGTPRPNMDLVSALARLQGIDVQEHHGQMNSPGHMGQFPSGSRSQQNWMSNQFAASHSDALERNWSDPNGQLQNSLMESQFTQLHLAAEKQKRGMKADFSIEESNHGLADLLHQKLVLQSSQPLGLVDGAPTASYDNRDPSWLFSRPATDHSFNLAADKVGLGDSFAEGSLFAKLGQAPQERSMNVNLEGQANASESSGRLAFRSSSGALTNHKQFFSDIGEIEKEQLADSMSGDVSRDRIDFSALKEGMRVKQHSSRRTAMGQSVLDTLEGGVEQAGASVDHEALKIRPVKHASFGGTGGGANLYNYELGADNAYIDEMVNDRMSGIFSRGSGSSLLKRTHDPHILSSQGALPELVPVPPMKGKNPTSFTYSDEVRRDRDPTGNLAVQVSESSSTSTRFRRTSSYSDADAPEASFIDMLKGTRKPMPEADASSGAAESPDAGPGGRSSKKKGKKGRQIDPSLLGFKVHSNRILMGEIQRPDE